VVSSSVASADSPDPPALAHAENTTQQAITMNIGNNAEIKWADFFITLTAPYWVSTLLSYD